VIKLKVDLTQSLLFLKETQSLLKYMIYNFFERRDAITKLKENLA